MGNMVVCPESLPAQIGRDVFAAGGNAADAAVATAFAQTVVSPMMTSIGGTAMLYYYDAETRRRIVLHCGVAIGSRPVPDSWERESLGRSETWGRYIIESDANQVGHQSIMTPGFVRGCWTLFQQFGSGNLSWAELLSPSVRLAGEGFVVDEHIADTWGATSKDYAGEVKPGYPGLMDKLRISADALTTFLNERGEPFQVGDRLTQPVLAQTIQRLADAGGDDFYTGEIADAIQHDMAANDGFITAGDLAGYTVDERAPLVGRYREYELTATPESSGAHMIAILQMLAHFDLPSLVHNSSEYVDTVARVQRASFADNVKLKGLTPDAGRPLEQAVIDPARAEHWARRILSGDRVIVHEGTVDSGTTHVTTMDAQRNAVTFTHSVGSIAGSGVVTPGLGFLYNNFLGHFNTVPGQPDSIEPGKKMGAGLPTMVFKDDEPYVVIGAPGGSRLITSAAQAVINVLAHGMNMRDAVSRPRFHSEEGQIIFMEPAFPDETEARLRALGNDIVRSSYMSCVQAIRVRPEDSQLEAGPDPRGGEGVGAYP